MQQPDFDKKQLSERFTLLFGIFIGVCLLMFFSGTLLLGGSKTWDSEGAASCFQQAWNRQEALDRTVVSNRSKKDYLRIVHLYEQVWLKDPHFRNSDDAMFYASRLWKSMGDHFHDQRYYQNSWDQLQILFREYPKTSFRPMAHYEAALALEKIRQPKVAKEQLLLIIERFPGAREAEKAKELLASWESKPPVVSSVRKNEKGKSEAQGSEQGAATPAELNSEKKKKSPSVSPDPSSPAGDVSSNPSRNSVPIPGAKVGSEQADSTSVSLPAVGKQTITRTLGLKIQRIILDPGHGGHDTGTISKSGLMEKNLVLDLALRLKQLLQVRLNAEVLLTRETDTFLPLEERTRMANRQKADLFISIHANHSSNQKVSGVETFFLNWTQNQEDQEVATRENAATTNTISDLEDMIKAITRNEKRQESRDFAESVQNHLYKAVAKVSPGTKNRGVKQAPFVVLIGASMPSVLAEVAFLSHSKTVSRLNRDRSKNEVAAGLYKGIAEYVNSLSRQAVVSRSSPLPSR